MKTVEGMCRIWNEARTMIAEVSKVFLWGKNNVIIDFHYLTNKLPL